MTPLKWGNLKRVKRLFTKMWAGVGNPKVIMEYPVADNNKEQRQSAPLGLDS